MLEPARSGKERYRKRLVIGAEKKVVCQETFWVQGKPYYS
jgi:hypothetical protein